MTQTMLGTTRVVAVLEEDESDIQLTPTAIDVLRSRYLKKDEHGEIVESPKGLFKRVASVVAGAEHLDREGQDVAELTQQFYNLMSSFDFLPNSPTLMNAGIALGQLSACFVLPVEDDLEHIFEMVKQTALIHQSGGGTGFSFSRLRPSGDVVKSTGGIASGPVSFMRAFDTGTDVIKQGGRRRGANMAVLRVDHPDILEFIDCKHNEKALNNFNISVGVADSFMGALQEDREFALVNPRTGKPSKQIAARDVFDRLVQSAWLNGEPGLIFLDRMNEFNPTPQLGDYESTNPCGEQVLLPFESCNLGSINLSRFVTEGPIIDWSRLERVTKLATHFLDNVIAINHYPLKDIRTATLATRKIGLGVMGFAEMLFQLGIPYDSEDAEQIAGKVMEAISYWSKEKSCELAASKGSFLSFQESRYATGWLPMREELWESRMLPKRLSERIGNAPVFDWETLSKTIMESGLRNATTTTIAPTGSIGIIANTPGGIEPLFALSFKRSNILDKQGEYIEVNHYLLRAAEQASLPSKILEQILAKGTCQFESVSREIQRVFVTAHDIPPDWHVRIQAAFQSYTDNAVSKTINFPEHATAEDVRQTFLLAYRSGCKGVTVYRDGSRKFQVLQKREPVGGGKAMGTSEKKGTASSKSSPKTEDRTLKPRTRPAITLGFTEKVQLGCGQKLYITVNEDEYGLFEVFGRMGKSGGCMSAHSEALGRLISISIRSGVDVSEIVRTLRGIRCPAPALRQGGYVLSCADAIGQALERHQKSRERGVANVEPGVTGNNGNGHDPVALEELAISKTALGSCPECPECGSLLEFGEGCVLCRVCGFSRCG